MALILTAGAVFSFFYFYGVNIFAEFRADNHRGSFDIVTAKVSEDEFDWAFLDSLYSQTYEKPKNVILLIGDGMGENSVVATRYLKGGAYNGKMAMEYLPNKGYSVTYSVSGLTDSAAGGTALSTGYKTWNTRVAVDKKGNELRRLTDVASDSGKMCGVVVTKTAIDATPAVFCSHASGRYSTTEVIINTYKTLSSGTVDLLYGGGKKDFYAADVYPYMQKALADGSMDFVAKWSAAVKKNLDKPLLGLFAVNRLSASATPSLTEMTVDAISKLENDNGFFLMVEGSQIDSFNHYNEIDNMTDHLKDFDNAVSYCMRYAASHPDTVIVVTADHETGGLKLPENPSEDNIKEAKYTTTGHTGANVPIYAIGYGTEYFNNKTVDNTAIAKFLAEIMGEENFGDPELPY